MHTDFARFVLIFLKGSSAPITDPLRISASTDITLKSFVMLIYTGNNSGSLFKIHPILFGLALITCSPETIDPPKHHGLWNHRMRLPHPLVQVYQ